MLFNSCSHNEILNVHILYSYIYTDISECQLQSYSCPSGSKCIDTEGGYMCQCKFGRRGLNCRPIFPAPAAAVLGNHKSHRKQIRSFRTSFMLFMSLDYYLTKTLVKAKSRYGQNIATLHIRSMCHLFFLHPNVVNMGLEFVHINGRI